MAYYNEDFSIINGSPYTLVLDPTGSSGLGDGNWPASIPSTTTAYVKQTGNADVNPTAVYQCQGANPPVTIYMHFHCINPLGVVHVNMSMQFSPGPPFPGSCIWENNSKTAQQRCTPDDLSLDHHDGSVNGSATFTIGAP
jgi:hypothetical protein